MVRIFIERCADTSFEAYNAYVEGLSEVRRDKYAKVEDAVSGCVHDLIVMGFHLNRGERLQIEIVQTF